MADHRINRISSIEYSLANLFPHSIPAPQGALMTERTSVHRLQVDSALHQFINTQVLPGTGVEEAAFWRGFDAIVADMAPKNIATLAERDRLQTELDAWHRANPGPVKKMKRYRAFLQQIGYLVPVPA